MSEMIERIDALLAIGWENTPDQLLRDCRAEIERLEAGKDALIAEAIEKHDDEMADIRTVNTRKMAQPYLDALIAEIDAISTFSVSGGHGVPSSQAIGTWKLKPILDKYRSAK